MRRMKSTPSATSTRTLNLRLTNGSPYYYSAIVTVDGVTIVDFLWADEETGEVMSVTYGPRDQRGYRDEYRTLIKGSVKIIFTK